VRAAALVVLAVASCGKGATASKEVTGTLKLEGEAVTVTKCRPDRGADGTYVVLETAKGAIRFENKQLWWNAQDNEGIAPGAVLDCKKLDRSWGGGVRTDGSSYFRGTLAFDCSDGPKTAVGDLTLDCGNITAEERGQLDQHRKEMQDEQKQKAAGSATMTP
jgi:hypothetical protein